MHPDVDVRARHVTDPRRPAVKIHLQKVGSNAKPYSHRSSFRGGDRGTYKTCRGRLCAGAVRLARVGQIGQDLSCHQPEGSHADAEREGREVRLRPTHRPRPRVTVAKHGRPVVVVLSVEEYERLKALDTPETRPKKEEGE